MARCLAEISAGELRIPLPLFQGTVTTISRVATRRNLFGLDRLQCLWYQLRCCRLAFARTTALDGQFRYDVRSGGEGFIRLNIACPRALLADGLERMARLFYREVF